MSTIELPRSATAVTTVGIEAAHPSLRILVVDGNPVPRAILARLLSRAGHEVTAVDSVAHAAEALRAARFDVMFIALAACRSDPHAVVRTLRSIEADVPGLGSREARMAIVGLGTTGSENGAARTERCDFDATLALPIESRRLTDLIDSLRDVAPHPAPDAFTRDVFEAQFGTDRALVARLAGVFTANAHKLLGVLERSLQASDAPMIGAAAHSLKGSLAMLGARRAAAAAQRLESAAVGGELAALGPLAAALRGELDEVVQTLTEAAAH
jgi:two-component system sensor histidine kinase/response regulator